MIGRSIATLLASFIALIITDYRLALITLREKWFYQCFLQLEALRTECSLTISWFVTQIVGSNSLDSRLFLAIVAVGVFLILKLVMFLLSTRLSRQAAYRILCNIRLQLAQKLICLSLGYILERNSGVIKKIMGNNVEEESFLTHNIPQTISSAVVPIALELILKAPPINASAV